MQNKGLNITIGTDGVASNNSLDMFKEMFLVATLSKVNIYNAEVVSASDVLKMLGYAKDNWSTTLKRKCKGVIKCCIPHPQSKTKTMEVNIIPERDIYSLIENSELISCNIKQSLIEWLSAVGLIRKCRFLHSREEIEFLDQLEQALQPFNIKGIRQYSILSYRIDYYIPSLKIAIEYDENEHSNYTYEQQEGRQRNIEKELGCRFIRVSDKNTDSYNIGFVIKNIFNINKD